MSDVRTWDQVDNELKDGIEDALGALRAARMLKAEAQAKEKDAKDWLGAQMTVYNYTSFISNKGERIDYVESSEREALDKEKLRAELLLKGVDNHVIEHCFNVATTVTKTKPYVKYTPKKEE